MEELSVILIGHITDDLFPYPHAGGGVTYSAIAARRLLGENARVKIITKCPPEHQYIKELENLGIEVLNLSTSNKMTKFENFYDKEGNRQQRVLETADPITLEDFDNFSSEIEKGSLIIVAPVINEVQTSLFPKLSEKGFLAVTPQGYFREVGRDNLVVRKPWKEKEYLSYAQAAVLSHEDLTFDKKVDQETLEHIVKKTNILVLTEGIHGSTVFGKRESFHVNIYEIEKKVDPTGAGDTYSTAFFVNYILTRNLRESAVFASLVSAIKVDGKEGRKGIETIPTLAEIQEFINNKPREYEDFLRANKVSCLTFLEGGFRKEGNQLGNKKEIIL